MFNQFKEAWLLESMHSMAHSAAIAPALALFEQIKKPQRDKTRHWSIVCGEWGKSTLRVQCRRGVGPWRVIFAPGKSHSSVLTNYPGKEEKLLFSSCLSPFWLVVKLGFPFSHRSPNQTARKQQRVSPGGGLTEISHFRFISFFIIAFLGNNFFDFDISYCY